MEQPTQCDTIVERTLHPTLKDPKSFMFSCTIGKEMVDKAQCDMGANMNILLLSLLKELGGKKVKPIKIVLQLLYRSTKNPYSIIEDV
ncbi:hypothetical protein CR513_60866, partial [Mucuna pruriens]